MRLLLLVAVLARVARAPDYGAFVPQEEIDPAVVPSSIKKRPSRVAVGARV